MRKSIDFLEALQHLKGWNDSEIARQLGVSNQAVSRWRNGVDVMGAENAVRVAKALEIEPDYVLACVQAERFDSELTRPFFDRLVERARGPKALRLVPANCTRRRQGENRAPGRGRFAVRGLRGAGRRPDHRPRRAMYIK